MSKNSLCLITSIIKMSKPHQFVPHSSPGEIPELYSDDEIENIISNVRNEVKSQGLLDSRENCWKFFIDRVRRQLKVQKDCWARAWPQGAIGCDQLDTVPLNGLRRRWRRCSGLV